MIVSQGDSLMIALIGYIGFLTLIASIVAFISGFGLSTIMTSLLIFILPLAQIIVIVGIIHWTHSLWKLLIYKKYIDWRIGLLFGLPAMAASFGGALLFTYAHHAVFSRVLGLFLMIYSLILFVRPSLRIEPSEQMLVAGGMISGFFAGLFGIRGAIRAAALSSFDLRKEVYVATTGFISLLVDTIRLITYWYAGMVAVLDMQLRWGVLIFILLSFVGALIGRIIVDRIPQHIFRSVVAAFIFLAGFKLLVWPL